MEIQLMLGHHLDGIIEECNQKIKECNLVMTPGSGVPRGRWSYHLGQKELAEHHLDFLISIASVLDNIVIEVECPGEQPHPESPKDEWEQRHPGQKPLIPGIADLFPDFADFRGFDDE